ncbi:unnamed protein product [Miscanthus lutarioriparius]|uniref:Uncharacterized protein n=1 Tax=Miscanthus lutarioriparius TaxID=422564 RepID=A0A811RLW8_9POAL|nr:unnamed protein product [Miscanthus lutarioriparius]
MTLRSPPGALDHPKLLQATSPTTSSSRDHHRLISSLSVVDDMLPRSPKLLRTNSSKKVPAASNLERALLSFKSWEASAGAIDDANKPAAGVAAAVPVPPASPVQRRIHGARPGRLALHSPTMAAADTTVDVLRSPLHEAAATRVQKMFKGHRTRRTLADCAIVIEELWWKLCDSASLDRTSISFFTATAGGGKQETAASRRPAADSLKRMASIQNERAAYQVVVEDGRLTYLQTGLPVNTTDESKWIFVLSTTRSLYVGQKRKGQFQHSSFLAGGATQTDRQSHTGQPRLARTALLRLFELNQRMNEKEKPARQANVLVDRQTSRPSASVLPIQAILKARASAVKGS